jgi:hypothetical protein
MPVTVSSFPWIRVAACMRPVICNLDLLAPLTEQLSYEDHNVFQNEYPARLQIPRRLRWTWGRQRVVDHHNKSQEILWWRSLCRNRPRVLNEALSSLPREDRRSTYRRSMIEDLVLLAQVLVQLQDRRYVSATARSR